MKSQKFDSKMLSFKAHIMEKGPTEPTAVKPEEDSSSSSFTSASARTLAIILSLFGASSFSLVNYLIKVWGIDFTDYLISRSTLQLIIMPMLIWYRGDQFWPEGSSLQVKWLLLVAGNQLKSRSK